LRRSQRPTHTNSRERSRALHRAATLTVGAFTGSRRQGRRVGARGSESVGEVRAHDAYSVLPVHALAKGGGWVGARRPSYGNDSWLSARPIRGVDVHRIREWRRCKIENADGAGRTSPIDRTAVQGTPGCRARESRAPAALAALTRTVERPQLRWKRPTLLDPPRRDGGSGVLP
jgi:hypothetical protein